MPDLPEIVGVRVFSEAFEVGPGGRRAETTAEPFVSVGVSHFEYLDDLGNVVGWTDQIIQITHPVTRDAINYKTVTYSFGLEVEEITGFEQVYRVADGSYQYAGGAPAPGPTESSKSDV